MSTEIKKELVEKIELLNKKRSEFETTKNVLDKQKQDLDAEIRQKGYDPEKLPESIKKMEEEISAFEKEAEPVVNDIMKKLSTTENAEHTAEEFEGFEQHKQV